VTLVTLQKYFDVVGRPEKHRPYQCL